MSKHGGGSRRGTESKHRRHRQPAANRRSERGEGITVRAESWRERGEGEGESANVGETARDGCRMDRRRGVVDRGSGALGRATGLHKPGRRRASPSNGSSRAKSGGPISVAQTDTANRPGRARHD
jgi:hypothetical protein